MKFWLLMFIGMIIMTIGYMSIGGTISMPLKPHGDYTLIGYVPNPLWYLIFGIGMGMAVFSLFKLIINEDLKQNDFK